VVSGQEALAEVVADIADTEDVGVEDSLAAVAAGIVGEAEVERIADVALGNADLVVVVDVAAEEAGERIGVLSVGLQVLWG
jgi:K+-sensing histidine kinase KdpD